MTALRLVAASVLLAVALLVGLPSGWYALQIGRLVEGMPLPAGAGIADVLSVLLVTWTLAMVALVAGTFRWRIDLLWFLVLIVLTVLLGAAHLELVHSKVHLACVQELPLGFTVNCAPWLPHR